MYKQGSFIFSLIALIVLITLHTLGSYYNWYWLYPWFDIVVHIISGLWAALLIFWLASCLGQMDTMSRFKLKSLLICLVSALLIGVLWELLEKISQITSPDSSNYFLHVLKDLISDALGGIIGYFYVVRSKKVSTPVDNADVLHSFYNQTGIIK